MTGPVPFADDHAELLADLARTLPLDEGLARISPGHAAAREEPGQDDHATLLTQLGTTLRLPDGLRDILDAESGHAGLVDDLSATLDTASGLAAILGLAPAVPPETPTAGGEPPVATASSGHQRLQFRATGQHRHLEVAMRHLRDIRQYLAAPHTGRTGLYPGIAFGVLRTQQIAMRKAATALATSRPGPADAVPHVLTGHIGAVVAVAFLADGPLAAAGADETVRLWNLDTGKAYQRQLATPSGTVVAASFSHDGRLATATFGGVIRFWNPAGRSTGELITRAVARVAFDPSSRRLLVAAAASGILDWCDTETLEHLATHHIRNESAVTALAVSRDGQLATGDGEGTVRLWDTDGEAAGASGRHAAGVTALAFSPTDSFLAVGGSDGSVLVWDPSTWMLLAERRVGGMGSITALAFSPDGRVLAIGTEDGLVCLWDPGASSRDVKLDDMGRHLRLWDDPRKAVQDVHTFEELTRGVAEQLQRLRDALVGGGMGSFLGTEGYLMMADELGRTMAEVWAAISDFRGADLRAVVVELENLDGVRWSDGTAVGGATRWPAGLRELVVAHSVPAPQPGVFEVRLGAVVGVG